LRNCAREAAAARLSWRGFNPLRQNGLPRHDSRPVRFRTMAAALALGVMPLAALAPATPALAQAEASNDAEYEELFAAMEAAIDQKLVLDASLAALAREFAGTAEFSQASRRG
jgi:hypothetical protein